MSQRLFLGMYQIYAFYCGDYLILLRGPGILEAGLGIPVGLGKPLALGGWGLTNGLSPATLIFSLGMGDT